MGEISKKQYIILLFLLAIVFFKSYSLHFNYPFPYHHDEWQHLTLSIQAMDSGYNKQYNPYLGKLNDHSDLESGFHVFLSSLFLITNLDPILSYQYLAALFSVFGAASLFLCVFRLSKKPSMSFISVIIFLFLPTNVNILGKDFFVPLTMAIPFIFLFSLYYIESMTEKNIKKFNLSLFFLMLLFLIHPPSFIIVSIPAILESLYNLDSFKEPSFRFKKRYFFLLFLIILVLFSLIWKGEFSETKRYIKDLLFFEEGWGKLEITFFIPLLYGIFNSLFGILGFIYGYKKKYRFFVFMAFFAIAITALFNLSGFTVFVPYSRAVHYAMLAMIPLTAFGFNIFLDYFGKIVGINTNKGTTQVVAIILLIFLVSIQRYDLNTKYSHYSNRVIDDSDYNTLLWIRDNIGVNNTFVTPYFMTSAVYPVSKNKVISLIPAQMEGGPIEDNLNFFNYDCFKKKQVILLSGANYVLSKIKLSCDYLEEIYSKGDYIYKVGLIS